MNTENLIKLGPNDISRLLGVRKAKLMALLEPKKYLFDHIDTIKKVFSIPMIIIGICLLCSVNYQSQTSLGALAGVALFISIMSCVASVITIFGADEKVELIHSGLIASIGVVFSFVFYVSRNQMALHQHTSDSDGAMVIFGVIFIGAGIALFVWLCSEIYSFINSQFDIAHMSFSLAEIPRLRLSFVVPDSILNTMKDILEKNSVEYCSGVMEASAYYVSNKFKCAPANVLYAIERKDDVYLIGIGSKPRKNENPETKTEKTNHLSNAEVNAIRASMKRMREA